MDRDRSFKAAWDVFGAGPPTGRTAAPPARHQAAPPARFKATKDAGEKHASSDSAISGSSDEDEREICRIFDYLNEEDKTRGKTRRGSATGARQKDKTTGGEIQHIERHLSMKKTLRKKMMRDLKQAFVDDPNEFRQDPTSIPDEQRNLINIQNMHISPDKASGENNFLGMLKDEPDSGHGSPTREHERRPKEKLSLWKRLTGGGKKAKR